MSPEIEILTFKKGKTDKLAREKQNVLSKEKVLCDLNNGLGFVFRQL
jgi:hypothetical protein